MPGQLFPTVTFSIAQCFIIIMKAFIFPVFRCQTNTTQNKTQIKHISLFFTYSFDMSSVNFYGTWSIYTHGTFIIYQGCSSIVFTVLGNCLCVLVWVEAIKRGFWQIMYIPQYFSGNLFLYFLYIEKWEYVILKVLWHSFFIKRNQHFFFNVTFVCTIYIVYFLCLLCFVFFLYYLWGVVSGNYWILWHCIKS